MGWGDVFLPPTATPPPAGECHLWPVSIADHPDLHDLLDAAEQRQVPRYLVEHARRTFVMSRAMQRLIGAHYLGKDPRSVTIDRRCSECGDDHGRPRWVAARHLDYSVSHAGAWLLVAVVGSGRVGVDVEHAIHPLHDDEALASRVLTPGEQACRAALPREHRTGWFYRAWSRKEAAVKLAGHGLRVQLSDVDVSGPAVLSPASPPDWPSEPIWLWHLPAPPEYAASLATTDPLRTIRNCGPVGTVAGTPQR